MAGTSDRRAAKAEPPRGVLPVLKVPDPQFNLTRFGAEKTTGMLSRLERKARVGKRHFLVNEVGPKVKDAPFVWAVVVFGEAQRFADTSKVPRALRGGIDQITLEEFAAGKGPVFYLPLRLVATFKPPVKLRRSPPVASEISIEQERVRKGAPAETEGHVALTKGAADDLRSAQDLAKRLAKEAPAFVERTLRFLEGPEDVVAFLKSLSGEAEKLAGHLARVDAGTLEKQEKSRGVIAVGAELLKLLQGLRPSLAAVKGAVDDGIKMLEALGRLSKEFPRAEDISQVAGLKKNELAPIHGSGEELGDQIELNDVLSHFKTFKLRMPFIYLVGGLPNRGGTKNDIDILVKGNIPEDMRHVIHFRLGRMLPKEMSGRIQMLDDEFAGPFTHHVELADLVVQMRPEFEVKQMCLAKQDDPLLDLPKKKGPHPAVLQAHFRGKSLHIDLRFKIDDHLVGWTLSLQKPGAVKESVETVAAARSLTRGFDVEGSALNKPLVAPAKVFATPKSRQPIVWMGIDNEVIPEGEIGATAQEKGVIVVVDKPQVEWGTQTASFHEYFLTGGKHLSGIMFFRQLVGEKPPAGEEEEGRITPAGETFWTAHISKELLPSVLKRRAVETKRMPPDGYSWIPVSLEKVTPAEFRYWEHKGAEAREVRDALVGSKFFTTDNIKIVNNEFRRVVRKSFLYAPSDKWKAENRQGRVEVFDPRTSDWFIPDVEKAETLDFALSWQFWKGSTVVRGVPSRQVYHLMIDRPGAGLDTWVLQRDPLIEEKQITAVLTPRKQDDLLTFDGEVEPGGKVGGDVLNDTKATPSTIRIQDKGKVEILDDQKTFKKLRFKGEKLEGVFTLVAEEIGSEVWFFKKGEEPGRAIPTEKLTQDMNPKPYKHQRRDKSEKREFHSLMIAAAKQGGAIETHAGNGRSGVAGSGREIIAIEKDPAVARRYRERVKRATVHVGDCTEVLRRLAPLRRIAVVDVDPSGPPWDAIEVVFNTVEVKNKPLLLLATWGWLGHKVHYAMRRADSWSQMREKVRVAAKRHGFTAKALGWSYAVQSGASTTYGAFSISSTSEHLESPLQDPAIPFPLIMDKGGRAIPTEKKLTPSQQADVDRESAKIKENKQKPEASKPHKFKPANWTHPNGHPRCLMCGDEETMSGVCNAPTVLEEAVSSKFSAVHDGKDIESDDDGMESWDRDLDAARKEVLARERWAGYRTAKSDPVDCVEIDKRHSRTQCMRCSKRPAVEVLWADGRGRAWFCDSCYAKWEERHDVIRERAVDGEVGQNWGEPAEGSGKTVAKEMETKTVTLADGTKLENVQVWDPAKIKDEDDKGADRADLKPLALFKPQKVAPRPTNEFREVDEAISEFAKPDLLKEGVYVEPKINGFRAAFQKDEGGRTLMFTEELFDRKTEMRDLLKNLPSVAKEVAALPGPFVLDAEFSAVADGAAIPRRELAEFRGAKPVDDSGVRLFTFDALYLPGVGNITQKSQTDRGELLAKFLKGRKLKHVVPTPRKLAKTEAELRDAIKWASRQQASEGAMLKASFATYSLGGENDGWAKLKLAREIRAIVHGRHPVKDSPGVFNFLGAVGPIPKVEAGEWKETVEVAGKIYTPIGKTFNSKLDAKEGDTIIVEVTEILVDESGPKRSITWFTPTVIDKTDKPLMTHAEVRELAQPGEVKKSMGRYEGGEVRLLKQKEERYVLGIVLEPNDGKDGAPLEPDSQKDIYSAGEIRKTAHLWMEEYGLLGLMHQIVVGGTAVSAKGKVKVLETYLAPSDFEIDGERVRKGTWLLAIRVVDNEIWKAIKEGKLTGFSIGGTARRSRARAA